MKLVDGYSLRLPYVAEQSCVSKFVYARAIKSAGFADWTVIVVLAWTDRTVIANRRCCFTVYECIENGLVFVFSLEKNRFSRNAIITFPYKPSGRQRSNEKQ